VKITWDCCDDEFGEYCRHCGKKLRGAK
jgi:hypothetical protein